MKILSLFDGMACGMLAMLSAGIKVDRYVFPVSDSQAYKMLGNGWTVEVIAHLIKATQTAARKKWLDDLLGDCL